MNSRKRQLNLSYRLSTGYQFYSDDFPSGFNNDETKFNASASFGLDNRFFFKPKRFFEVGVGASLAYNPNNINYGTNRKEIVVTADVSPRLGFGRIEKYQMPGMQ